MPNLAHWSVFLTATIILLLIPGHSVIYVVSRALEAGYRGAVFSSLGLALGDLLQVLCTVVGISALLASSPALFTIVKYAGAGYLIFLGLHRLLRRNRLSLPDSVGHPQGIRPISSRQLVLQGFFALNPKTALFFLALFPQFVAEDAGPPWLQILLFGCAFVGLGFLTNSAFGCVGGKFSSLAKRSPRFQVALGYGSGVVLVAMGVAAALAPVSLDVVESAQ